MFNAFQKLLIALLLFTFLPQLRADDSVVFFVNGIGNTEQQANESRTLLSNKLGVNVDVRLLYNRMNGKVNDTASAVNKVKKLQGDGWDSYSNETHNQIKNDFVPQMKGTHGKSVTLVPHSEGNIYVNRFLNDPAVSGILAKSNVKTIATASPIVYGKDTANVKYTVNKNDILENLAFEPAIREKLGIQISPHGAVSEADYQMPHNTNGCSAILNDQLAKSSEFQSNQRKIKELNKWESKNVIELHGIVEGCINNEEY